MIAFSDADLPNNDRLDRVVRRCRYPLSKYLGQASISTGGVTGPSRKAARNGGLPCSKA